ncbi:MAG TPA: DUF6438 domain-containing protein [Bacteroidia bacterium]|nr:DUF6438 domain-containing protein [Bacteroidia bacterium]
MIQFQKHFLLIFSFCFSLLVSCKVKDNNSVSKSVSNDSLFLSIDKSPCFGACPTYTMVIYSNGGKSTLSGKKFTKNLGKFEYVFSNDQIKDLKVKITEADFFNLKDSYDDERVMDLPMSTIDVFMGGVRKKVVGRYETPKEFRVFETYLDSLASLPVWQKVKPPVGDD